MLALPAGAVMEKGEPNITAQTTMKEVRNNPGIKNSGFYTYSQDKDCPPGQALWEMTTVEGYTNEYVAEGCAKGLNLVIENYNNGVQVTHSFYTDAEKAEDRTKNNTGLFYFPAKAENAKFALILAGSGANESAELEEGGILASRRTRRSCSGACWIRRVPPRLRAQRWRPRISPTPDESINPTPPRSSTSVLGVRAKRASSSWMRRFCAASWSISPAR